MRIILLGLLAAAFFIVPVHGRADQPKELKIVRITPEGDDIRPSKQIIIEFNRPVVPIGKMDRMAQELGITVTPALNCQWRWLNTSSLSCNLNDEDAMKPATSYTLAIDPVIAAEDGARIAEIRTHQFITSRPLVENTDFKTWRGPSSPVIRLIFNQPVTKSSVAAHIYIKEISSKSSRYAIAVSPDEDDQELPVFLPVPGEKENVYFKNGSRKSDDQATQVKGEEARRIWLVEPQEILPTAADMALIAEDGLISAMGPETGIGSASPVVTFLTYPAFTFLGVKCYDKNGKDVLLAPDKPQTPEQLCNPLSPVALGFSVPVLRSQVKENLIITPDLAGGRKDFNPWGDENRDWSRLHQPYRKGDIFYVGLPAGLKAAQNYSLSLINKKAAPQKLLDKLFRKKMPVMGLRDEFGRELEGIGAMAFSTGHRNPNFEIAHHEAVLEKGVDSEVPLYVNNLKSATLNYRSVTADSAQENQKSTRDVSGPQDVQFAVPMGVRKMLGDKSGALYGFLDTDPPTGIYEGGKRLFAQVTPYQIHLKLGHFQSMAWITDLATGQPVADAKVTLYKSSLNLIGPPGSSLAAVKTDADGLAILPGTDKVDPDLGYSRAWEDSAERLFLRVDKGNDMALMPLSDEFAVGIWNVSNGDVYESNRRVHGHMQAWGMTAQGIYRAGDTIQYKIYVRDQNNQTLIPPPGAKYGLVIRDPAGKIADKVENIALSRFGAYAGEFPVSENAAVGWYNFDLKVSFGEDGPAEEEESDSQDGKSFTLHPLRVLVSDFTPAPFHVSNSLSGDHFRAGDKVDIAVDARLHSGGPYTNAAVRTTIMLKSRDFTSADKAAEGFIFNSFTGQSDSLQLSQTQGKLDQKGEARESFTLPRQNIVYGQLQVESAVQDDRGKSIASMAQADYFGIDRLAGLKSPQWVYEAKKPATLQAIVVDDHGTPVAGVPVDVQIEQQVISTARVKGAGNAYLSDTTVDWKKIASCAVTSAGVGQDCSFTPPAAGTYRMTASIKDTKGTAHQTHMDLWVTGTDYVQWNDQSELALPIVPEEKEYRVGDTARYLVRNPYPGAKALVTIERYGVIDSFVKTLDGSAPVIEFPVKPDYLPGFYLSIIVQSPRVAQPLGEGQIDLGKPAFRMGYVAVPVRDPYKEMLVDVKIANDVYKPRDTIAVDLNARPRFAPDIPQPVEVAVAVLDESVFDLIAAGQDAYDPYKGFYALDALDMKNYSLMTRLVGRQKFEKKGANPGGDGGADIGMRSIFKYVSYWNPSVPVDKDGKAHIEFQAPDNLTGWRVLAMAVTPGDRMGLGEGKFKVNLPIEIRPVMPNQIREGDKFEAGFSVMNRTETERTLKVEIEATGDIAGEEMQEKTQNITIAPYQRASVFIPLESSILPVDREIQAGKILFHVTASGQDDSDGLDYSIPVNKSRITNVSANYGTTTENAAQEHIAFPDDIHADTGDISVVLSPSVISSLTGAFRYIRDYPYPCWEQIITKAVMAADYQSLKSYLPEDFAWEESAGIPQNMLDNAAGFQAPNGGMAYFNADDQHADPYLSAYTALAFNWLRGDGYTIPSAVEEKLHGYLKNFLQQDAAPDFYQPGMKSTVRAVVLAALAEDGKATKDDLLRYQPHLKEMSLFGKAYFMRAAIALKDTTGAAREAAGMILSSGNETGGKFMFNETYDDGYARILATPLRDNCAILDAFMVYGADAEGKSLIGDKPFKLVRMITQSRGSRDFWENTQENMFCMRALADYAKIYESVKPDMIVAAALDGKEFGRTEFKSLTDKSVILTRPIEKTDPGQTKNLDITRDGDGRLYYATRLRTAPKNGAGQAVNAGIDIHREYSVQRNGKWMLLSSPAQVKRGELIRVDLFLSLPAARNFVVVNDPLPGGLETVNQDLATASTVDADAGYYDNEGGSMWFRFQDWREYNFSFWSFYHRELRHDSARFYADWLAPGNYHLSYTAQVIAEGEFNAPPVQAEEMYDPDVYGRGIAMELIAGPQE
jgi:uncharacterized protein YfaS (alpha-2-macroglobulin family)